MPFIRNSLMIKLRVLGTWKYLTFKLCYVIK